MLTQKQKFLKFIATFFLLLTLVFLPMAVHAAGLVPCGGVTEKPCTLVDAFYAIARITNWLILTSSAYLFYRIVNHGFWLAISGSNEENITKHKKGIFDGIIGFCIVMFAYMFMNTAVNFILMSKCKIDFRNALNYVTIQDPSKCLSASDPNFNPVNTEIVPK